jgi:hypothetical protein
MYPVHDTLAGLTDVMHGVHDLQNYNFAQAATLRRFLRDTGTIATGALPF